MNKRAIAILWRHHFGEAIDAADFIEALDMAEELDADLIEPAPKKRDAQPLPRKVRDGSPPKVKGLRSRVKAVRKVTAALAERVEPLLATGPTTTRELVLTLYPELKGNRPGLVSKQSAVMSALRLLRARPVDKQGGAIRYALPEKKS